MSDPLTSADIQRIVDNVNAINLWAEGDSSYTATLSNGRTVPSPSKLIADARMFKAPTAYSAAATYSDATQPVTESGVVYAPKPTALPIGPEAFNSNNWYVIQGHITGTELDQSGANIVGVGSLEIQTTADGYIFIAERTDGTLDEENQKIALKLGDSGISSSGVEFQHYSLESSVDTLRNILRIYDTGMKVHDANGDDIVEILTDKTLNWGLYSSGALGCLDGLSAVRPNLTYPIFYRSLSAAGSPPFDQNGHMVYQGSDGGTLGHYFLAGSSAAVRFCVEGGGSIGMGTDNPTNALHISSTLGDTGNPVSANTRLLIDYNANNSNSYIEFSNQAGNTGFQGILFSDDASLRGGIRYQHSVDYLLFNSGGAARWRIEGAGDLLPWANASYDVGSPSNQVDNIYSVNAVTVSDERRKNKLSGMDEIVELMKVIEPEVFSFKESIIPAKEAVMSERQAFDEIDVETEEIVLVNGKYKKKSKIIKKRIPKVKLEPIFDENGKRLTTVDEFGVEVDQFHEVPIMETYEEEPATPEQVIKHRRPHTGFFAQQIKAKMNEIGIDDWAGYSYHNEEGEDIHALRLQEFIAPMLKYIQQIEKRLEVIENK